jgi:hypothetical protein
MTAPIEFDIEWLRKRYIDDDMGTRAIAKERGCAPMSVVNALRRNGIPVKNNGGIRTHGETVDGKTSAEYRALKSAIERCHLPSSFAYPRYGGRGIVVCDRWRGPGGFANFLADMGRRPYPSDSLDRIDGNGGYCPSNCRWTDRVTQARQNRKLTDDQVRAIRVDTRSNKDIAIEYDVSRSAIGLIKTRKSCASVPD